MQLPDIYHFWLLDFPQVVDKVRGISRRVHAGSTGERCHRGRGTQHFRQIDRLGQLD